MAEHESGGGAGIMRAVFAILLILIMVVAGTATLVLMLYLFGIIG